MKISTGSEASFTVPPTSTTVPQNEGYVMRQAVRVSATFVSKFDFQIIQYDIPDNIFY